ncbi:MAG: integrase arm-type DNA-binding domain-containing protein [Motiliproteus sp.]
MGKLTDKDIKFIIKSERFGRHADGDGLYLCVRNSGKPYWALRYTLNSKRKLYTIGNYGHTSLADARAEAGLLRAQIAKSGCDPVAERHRAKLIPIKTTNDLFNDWHQDRSHRLKYPDIPRRQYERDVKPLIGSLALDAISPRDTRAVIQKIVASNRPTIANDVLALMKQLFNHGIKLDVMNGNPAAAFTVKDAGGVEKSRDRILDQNEITTVFEAFRTNSDQFTRENYLACALLLALGVRKMELLAAQWQEFDLENGLWKLSANNKTNSQITIPLSELALTWLKELKVRACGSHYVFPRRRASKRFSHMGPDTLNAAIQKLIKQGKIEPFTVHDLRRTLRSLLSQVGTLPHIAERCLNHKTQGVEGIYDRYDYIGERRKALNKIANLLAPIVDKPYA